MAAGPRGRLEARLMRRLLPLVLALVALLGLTAPLAGQFPSFRVIPASTPPDEDPPGDPGDYHIGYASAATERTRLQATDAAGGERERLQHYANWAVNVLLARRNGTSVLGVQDAPTEGNYYGEDAGTLASMFATFASLDPGHASWSGLVTWPAAIDTAQENADLACAVLRYSTRIRSGDNWSADGRTLLEKATQVLTSGNASTKADGPVPHIWKAWPAQVYSWAPYVRPRLVGLASAGCLADIDAVLEQFADVGLGHITKASSDYPVLTEQEGWNNTSFSSWLLLTLPGLADILDLSVFDATQEAAVKTALNRFYLRTKEEFAVAYTTNGAPAPGFHEGTGSEYARDNLTGVSRLYLWTWPLTGLNDLVAGTWLRDSVAQKALEILPMQWGHTPPLKPFAVRWGIIPQGHSNFDDAASSWALFKAALNRAGYPTQAGQFQWMEEQFGVNFTTIPSTTAKVPSAIYDNTGGGNSQYQAAWYWPIVFGKLGGMVSTPITSISTAKGPMGYRVWNCVFSLPACAARPPTEATLVALNWSDVAYYGHTTNDTNRGWSLVSRGGYVILPQLGHGKTGFGTHSTGGVRGRSQFIPWVDGALDYTFSGSGGIIGNRTVHPAFTNFSNASAWDRIATRYVDDPDNVNGGLVCDAVTMYATGVITTNGWQECVWVRPDDDVVVTFAKITPADPTNDVIVRQSVLPVQPGFENGTSSKLALGTWRSTNATTMRVVNHSGAAATFSATDQDGASSNTQVWARAHVNALLHYRSADAFHVYWFGHDPAYPVGALRNNLEIPKPGRDAAHWGRNTRSWRRCQNGAYTDGASTRVYLTCVYDETGTPRAVIDADLPDSLAGQWFAQSQGGNPGFRTIASVDRTTTPKSIILSGATVNWPIGTPRHFDLLDDSSSQNELGYDIAGDGADVRRVMGAGLLAIVPPGANPAKTELWEAIQLGDDDAPPTAATVTQSVETDVQTLLYQAGTTRIAFTVGRSHITSLAGGSCLASTDYLIDTLEDVEADHAELCPGSAWTVTGAVESGTKIRMTLSNSGGSFVVNSQGRLVVLVSEAGGVVSVKAAQ
jgi:hypothetical protein